MSLLRARGKLFCAHIFLFLNGIPPGARPSIFIFGSSKYDIFFSQDAYEQLLY